MVSTFRQLRRYAALISLLTLSVGLTFILTDQPDMRFVPISACSCSGSVQHNDVPIVFIGEIRAAERMLPSNGSSDQLLWKLDFKVTNAIKGVTQSEYQVWALGSCFWHATFEVGEVLEIRADNRAGGGLRISPCGGAQVVAPAPTPGTAARATQTAQKSAADADVERAAFLRDTGEAAVILMVLSGVGGLIILGALNLSRLALRWNERRAFGRRQHLHRRPVRKIRRPVSEQLLHSRQETEVERSEQGPDEFGKKNNPMMGAVQAPHRDRVMLITFDHEQDHPKFKQLIQKIDPQSLLLRTWPLKGGVSAQVTALEIERPDGQSQKLVVRQHGPTDLNQNPNIAADEFKLLQILRSHGLPVPTPYYLDQSREIFLTPFLVLEYIEGASEFAPSNLPNFLFQLATHLSTIHSIDCPLEDLSFLPKQQEIYTQRLKQRPTTLDESLHESRVRDTLEAVWPLPHPNKPVLLHGDFWPGNILWKDNRLTAIIDWEDAALGDALADLANTRLEILWAFGIEAMHTFTHLYKSLTTSDFTNLPYFDLCIALHPIPKIVEWAPDATIAKSMQEGLKLFITQALEMLAIR